MPEEIDWEGLAKTFQIENEILRGQVTNMSSYRRQPVQMSFSLPLKDILTWIESHPFTVIAIAYVVSTLLMDVVDISMKVRQGS